MSAVDLLKAGDLDGALDALQADIRSNAGNASLRIFLFQLLSVRGDWDRAIRQLKVSAEMDPAATAMAQTYREGIVCEVYREKVFAGEKDPHIFGEPQEWIALMVEALKANAAGNPQAAADARSKAFETAPTVTGTIDGKPFEWIADADMRLGPLLEAVVNGRYFWIPFTSLAQIEFEDPADLRDAVWTPATLRLPNGGDTVALIPTRYAGTTAMGSDTDKLARSTEWRDLGADTFAGFGQRVLTTNEDDFPLMDIRRIDLDVEMTAEPAPTDEADVDAGGGDADV